MSRRMGVIVAVMALGLGGWWQGARAAGDLYPFLPSGGKTLLLQLLQGSLPAEVRTTLVSSKKSLAEWQAYLRSNAAIQAAWGTPAEAPLNTLAAYLANNLPLSGSANAQGMTLAQWEQALPADGRTVLINACQWCHAIGLPIREKRTEERIRGILKVVADHRTVKLTPQEERDLTDFLLYNTPVENIPEEFLRGNATFGG